MTKTEAIKRLKAMGTAQNRKVYPRHGVKGELFGVSWADLGKLKKEIKADQALAEALWTTGNHDARILATMIAEPAAMKAATLDSWARDLDNYVASLKPLWDAMVETRWLVDDNAEMLKLGEPMIVQGQGKPAGVRVRLEWEEER